MGTGEDVNTPGMDTHLQIGSEETLTVIKKLETDMEQIFETDGYGVPGPREFRCHMIPIVTPDVPAKLNQVTETAYCIEFKVQKLCITICAVVRNAGTDSENPKGGEGLSSLYKRHCYHT